MRNTNGNEVIGDINPLRLSNLLSSSALLQNSDFNPVDYLAVDDELTQKFLDLSQTHSSSSSSLDAPNVPLAKSIISMDGGNVLRDGVFVKEELDDEDSFQAHEDEEVKISEMQTTLEAAMKNVLVCLIGEYLSEAITLRQFLTKIRQCLCSSESSPAHKEVFTWVLRCMLEGGSTDGTNHVHRMAIFLEENGVYKNEIEASSAAIKEDSANGDDADGLGDKRKRKDTKKSISRGLRSAPNKWTKAESQLLIRLVHENGDKSWKRIAEQLGGGKTGAQCAQHWKRVLSPQIKKGSWDDQEEELLLALVERYGQSWKNIAGEIKSRTDIQCRYQYQKSCLSRQCEWHDQEDALLLKKVAQMLHEGGAARSTTQVMSVNWVEVAKFIARAKLTKIPRTALECKQRWYLVRNNTHVINNSNSTLNSNNNTNNSPLMNTMTMENVLHNNTNNNIGNMNNHHHQFHNINYGNINNTFSMVSSSPYTAAVTPSF